MEKPLDKYQRWITQINKEALRLNYTQRVWNELTTIQNNSKHFKKTGRHLQEWINGNYICHVIMLISRICDPKAMRNSDRNLSKFLREVKDKQYICFERFLNTYNLMPPKENERKVIEIDGMKVKEFCTTYEDVEKIYLEITQVSKINDTCNEMIEKDLLEIETIFKSVGKLRDKRIAHLTKTKIKKVPTYQDVDENIKKLLNIIRKYNHLIFNVYETFDYCDLNIHTVFEKPWIEH